MYHFNEDIDFTSHGFSSLGVFQGLIGISRFKSYEQWVFTSKVRVLRFKEGNWFLQIEKVMRYTFYFLKVQNTNKHHAHLNNLWKYMVWTFVQVC